MIHFHNSGDCQRRYQFADQRNPFYCHLNPNEGVGVTYPPNCFFFFFKTSQSASGTLWFVDPMDSRSSPLVLILSILGATPKGSNARVSLGFFFFFFLQQTTRLHRTTDTCGGRNYALVNARACSACTQPAKFL